MSTTFCKTECPVHEYWLSRAEKAKTKLPARVQGGKLGGGKDGSFCFRILKAGVPGAVLNQNREQRIFHQSKGERTLWNPGIQSSVEKKWREEVPAMQPHNLSPECSQSRQGRQGIAPRRDGAKSKNAFDPPRQCFSGLVQFVDGIVIDT